MDREGPGWLSLVLASFFASVVEQVSQIWQSLWVQTPKLVKEISYLSNGGILLPLLATSSSSPPSYPPSWYLRHKFYC